MHKFLANFQTKNSRGVVPGVIFRPFSKRGALARKKNIRQVSWLHFDEQPKPISHLDIISEDQVKRFSQASFLIGTLKEPENSDYFRKVPPKGIRTTLFYVTDISQLSMSDILADDNGA